MGETRKGLPDHIRFPLVLGAICLVSGGLLGYVYSLTKPAIDKSKSRKVETAVKDLVQGYASFTSDETKTGVFFTFKNDKSEVIAYGAQTVGPGSYNTIDPIVVITVMDPQLERILGISVVNCKETAGLGTRIEARPAQTSLTGMITGSPKRMVVRLSSGDKAVYKVAGSDAEGVTVIKDGGVQEYLKGAKVTDEKPMPTFQAQFTGLKTDDLKFSKDGGKIDAISGATVSSRAVLRAVQSGVELIKSKASR
jgi:Na+-translocating ferredoxin:NAD+ oxidoreductase RnfG subunit